MKHTIRLTTAGRRSGKPREVTLYAFDADDPAPAPGSDGGRLVVVGSLGGAARHPAWVHNLRADPRAVVRRDDSETDVRATEADGDQRERLWALVCEAFPLYATYQRRTKRRIPLFVLDAVPSDRG